jgi:hypothetical protein
VETDASYQILRKESDNTTVLVEAVKGFEEAQKRVDELNDAGPGEHFIYDPTKANVVDPSHPGVTKDPFQP